MTTRQEKKPLSIYVHIPFCVSKCSYCNFVSFEKSGDFFNKYIQMLCKEIEQKSEQAKEYFISTIFIGGGTPSVLSSNQISKILKLIYQRFDVDKKAEISIETNPNSLTEEKAQTYKKIGINRVSIGLQSDSKNLLKLLNRAHNKKDYLSSIIMLKNAGFTNISTDIMVGLPKQKIYDIKRTIKTVIKQKIPHISLYSLILEENTPLAKMVKQKKIQLPSEQRALKMFETAKQMLTKNKLNRYEVANFATESYECKHNLVYWSMGEYLGFGLAAHEYFKNKRNENTENLAEYLAGKYLKQSCEQTMQDKLEETIMLCLRKTSGIDLQQFFLTFGFRLEVAKAGEIERLKSQGLLDIKNNYLVVTDLGCNVLNSIILRLV